MEFLHPLKNASYMVSLLLLVERHQKTFMMCYEWNTNFPLESMVELPVQKPIAESERVPLFLVPLMLSGAVMVVGEKSMGIYKGVMGPTYSREQGTPKETDQNLAPGNTRKGLIQSF